MIQLPEVNLSESALAALDGYQKEIDKKETYSEQVSEASRIWPSRSRNKPFREVRQALSKMCSGPHRCGYCEDSMGDEIEHIWPKSFYPDRTFIWENLMYACGPCNGPKNNRFAIFPEGQPISKLEELERPNEAPINPPPAGRPVLIDPRTENPLEYLWLDIQDSFAFTPFSDDEESEAWKRARYTIDILKLNTRDALVEARKNAFFNYRARLKEYLIERNHGAPQGSLDDLQNNLQGEHHRTVWKEMQRQHTGIDELADLFEKVPEALNW